MSAWGVFTHVILFYWDRVAQCDPCSQRRAGRETEEGDEVTTKRSCCKGGRSIFYLVAAIGCPLAIAPSVATASNSPANTLRELFTELSRCLVTPKGHVGSELTILFSLRRDGALLGRPKITFAKLPGDISDQRKFAEGVEVAFNRCLPVAITDGLGGAIAGRPLSMHFVIRARETDT